MFSNHAFLDAPQAVPDLGIPVSDFTVDIRIINTTCYQKTSTTSLLGTAVPGHDALNFPSYAFLITNRATGVHVLFDAGMRKDWKKACPLALLPYISDDGSPAPLQVSVEKDIVDILEADKERTGVAASDITAVIWSHHHFDHRGDMTRFGAATKLIVGPGLLDTYLEQEVHPAEVAGREVIELGPKDFTLEIAGCPSHDAFGDGSLYILSCPGHTVGHLCALARTTSFPAVSFVMLGGDCAYHCGEFRPSVYIPLPERVAFRSSAWAFRKRSAASPPILKSRKILLCAGDFIKDVIHPRMSATASFYDCPSEPIVQCRDDAKDSIEKLEIFDAHEDVLVCMSHDPALMSIVPFFPQTLNDWQKKGAKQLLHWEFLNDFDLDQNVLSPALPITYPSR